MKVLAIDTSSSAAAAAVMDENKLIAEYNLNHKKTHSQKIMPMIEEVLKSCDLSPEAIDVFGVSIGPGSFTGLRIGITCVKVMAQVLDKPVVGVSTLEGLAYNLPFCKEIICPIIDAQGNLLYTGIYRWDAGDLQILKEEDVLHIEELILMLKNENKNVIFVGDGIEKFRERLNKGLPGQAVFPPALYRLPRAGSVGALSLNKALKGEISSPQEIVPVYMRKSQAERQWEQKRKGRV